MKTSGFPRRRLWCVYCDAKNTHVTAVTNDIAIQQEIYMAQNEEERVKIQERYMKVPEGKP